MVIVYFTLVLFLAYSLLIIYYWLSWRSIPGYKAPGTALTTRVSVVIAARNEEKNIAQTLEAVGLQSYPAGLFEVIVVNDQSEDQTAVIASQFPNVKLVNIPIDDKASGKKNAISRGIAIASGELILTTDADCLPPENWIETMVHFRQEKKSIFIVAPVRLQCDRSIVQIFQALDLLVLQGITGASVSRNFHSMCNGANLAYDRAAFFEVEGFTGIDNIASGDDMLLMHKIAEKYPGGVGYLKTPGAFVSTQPMKTWKEFFNQRIRWASKARFYKDRSIFWALLLVYLFNLSFPTLLVAGIWDHRLWIYLVLLGLAKAVIEFPFAWSVAGFFKQRALMKYFLFFQPLHIFYTLIAGWLGQFKKYEWKSRIVR